MLNSCPHNTASRTADDFLPCTVVGERWAHSWTSFFEEMAIPIISPPFEKKLSTLCPLCCCQSSLPSVLLSPTDRWHTRWLCVSLEGDKAAGLMMCSLFVCKSSSLSQYRARGMGTQPGSALSLPEQCLCSMVSWVEGRPSEGRAAGAEMTLVEHFHAPDTPLGS